MSRLELRRLQLLRDLRVVWETAVELEPMMLYMMLLGGPWAPGVAATLTGTVAEPPPAGTFDPVAWNMYPVVVQNEDGSASPVNPVPFLPLLY